MHICEYFDVRQIFDPGANGVGREKGRVERGEGINLFWNEFKEATPFYFLNGLQLPSIEKRNDPSTWTKMTCPTPQISHSYSEGIFIILFSVLMAVKQPGYNDRWLVNIQYLLFFFTWQIDSNLKHFKKIKGKRTKLGSNTNMRTVFFQPRFSRILFNPLRAFCVLVKYAILCVLPGQNMLLFPEKISLCLVDACA